MKKTVVDYRSLRLHNLAGTQYRHLLLLLGWVIYFIFYFLTENFIPAENCTPMHSPLDDRIPFCEWFVIPYVGWYGLIVFSLIYFLLYSINSFQKLQTYIIIIQTVAVTLYILFPSRQDLRPDFFPRENILTDIMARIYSIDTNTGVCPSLHVACSLGIASTWLKEKSVCPVIKVGITVFCVLICLSVVFTKQHSIVDIYAAVPICLLAEILVFGQDYRHKIQNRRS